MGNVRDTGLFGPGSVTWRVHREPYQLLGGLRSLYLQALHPRTVAGVAQNSAYRQDPWGRFDRTSTYLGTIFWGTTAEAEAAGARLRRLHARMTAVDPRTGEVFRIDEPELLRWVHVTEVESFLSTAKRAGLALTDAEGDQFYRENLRAAELVGLDPSTVPATAAEVEDYYQQMQPSLAVTKDCAETALFLTVPPVPQGWGSLPFRLGLSLGPARWAYSSIVGTAIAMLPPWARRMYGGLGLPTTDVAADLSVRTFRLMLAALPKRYRPDPQLPPPWNKQAWTPPAHQSPMAAQVSFG